MSGEDPRVFHIAVGIPNTVFQELYRYIERTRCPHDISGIAGRAILQWLTEQECAAPRAGKGKALRGYQWKQLFLPSGTIVRTVFKGKSYHAKVEGDRLLQKGQPVSPSQFVNAPGGSVRNAWKALWVLLPNANEWKQAAALRHQATGSGPG